MCRASRPGLGTHALRAAAWLWRDPVLAILVVAFIVLQCVHPLAWRALPAMVDWRTVLTLAGLLMLAKAVESTGFVGWLAQRLLRWVRTERRLAWLMIGFAAALSTVLTNDVALFVVIPLALSLARIAPLRIERLVIFLALAVNAGSILTPLGNPQNLFLWQRSGMGFAAFVALMAPLALGLTGLLLVLAAVAFDARALHLVRHGPMHDVQWRIFAAVALSFVIFVMLADHGRAPLACALATALCLILRRGILRGIDWRLLLIFILMFIVLRDLAGLPGLRAVLARIDWAAGHAAYWGAALLSQAVSNVPAAILLAEYSHDWTGLAYGASVGGFGLAIGSLANLIALRMSGSRRIWWRFHWIAIPFWGVALLWGWWLS